MKNIIGAQVRRLRNERSWSQNQLATRLQLEGFDASRSKVSKIESGLIWVSDEEMMYIARAFKVELSDLQEPSLRYSKRLYDAVSALKEQRRRRKPDPPK